MGRQEGEPGVARQEIQSKSDAEHPDARANKPAAGASGPAVERPRH